MTEPLGSDGGAILDSAAGTAPSDGASVGDGPDVSIDAGAIDAPADGRTRPLRVDGNPQAPRSCNALCGERGLICKGDPQLGNSGAGGLVMTFGSDGGEPCTQVGYCDSNPAARSDCSRTPGFHPLVSYYCLCY